MRAEARLIEAAIPAGYWRVALDEHGRQVTTAEMAGLLRGWRQEGATSRGSSAVPTGWTRESRMPQTSRSRCPR
jgi:hypothetical protein